MLLLDSDEAFASALTRVLQSEGLMVSGTADSASAQEGIARVRPRYAVLDPQLTGGRFGIVTRLKQVQSSESSPRESNNLSSVSPGLSEKTSGRKL